MFRPSAISPISSARGDLVAADAEVEVNLPHVKSGIFRIASHVDSGNLGRVPIVTLRETKPLIGAGKPVIEAG
jgi:hypothetical protein